MKYFKIIRGYGAEDYIEIDQSELEKAYGSFLLKKDGIYSGGAVKGSEILAIQPDYHRTMGWNRGYKMTDLDYAEIKDSGIGQELKDALGNMKEKVTYLIESGNKDAIGLPRSKELFALPGETRRFCGKCDQGIILDRSNGEPIATRCECQWMKPEPVKRTGEVKSIGDIMKHG